MNFDESQVLWVEKYRPSKIEDCVLPARIKTVFGQMLVDEDFPSMLLSGSAGIGKTTISKALLKEMDIDWILINASNDRSIDVLRTRIQDFASTVSLSGSKFKCVIMDEFDHSTPLFQAAMRAAIEDFSRTCRFIFTCNYPNRIIDALHSRCSKIDLELRADERAEMGKQFYVRVCDILKNEGVEFDKPAIQQLVVKHFPDFRRVINEAQNLAKAGRITVELIKNASNDLQIGRLVELLKQNNFTEMRQWVAQNASADMNILFRKIYDGLDGCMAKASIPEAILIIARYMNEGTSTPDPEINMVACLTEIMVTVDFI